MLPLSWMTVSFSESEKHLNCNTSCTVTMNWVKFCKFQQWVLQYSSMCLFRMAVYLGIELGDSNGSFKLEMFYDSIRFSIAFGNIFTASNFKVVPRSSQAFISPLIFISFIFPCLFFNHYLLHKNCLVGGITEG